VANTLAYSARASTTKKSVFIKLAPVSQCYKTFFFVTDDEAKLAKALVPCKRFQPGLIFEGIAVAYLSGAPLLDRLLGLPANVRPGWKGLPGKNALAYLASSSVAKKKCFIRLKPGLQNSERSCIVQS
jgi:hypothetical protein